VGYRNIAENEEAVALTESFQCVQKDGAGAIIAKVREAAITTEGKKVKMPFRVVSLQVTRHGSIVYPCRLFVCEESRSCERRA